MSDSNKLKDKVGSGGLSEAILLKAQAGLDSVIEENGEEWVESLVSRLKYTNSDLQAQFGKGTLNVSPLIEVVLDLKSTALSVKDTLLARVASNLLVFVETADLSSPVTFQLVGAHVDAIVSLRGIDSNDRKIANKLVSGLEAAVQKVATL